ncbi:flap endonuclease Xni [Pseudaeromonas paramecii]|uniref:Flap endonuclease Xni n=1 Tax=Pseudaeromonas paramecii TaxID=2138166 RepID=A0ABP8Q603_9GAMM
MAHLLLLDAMNLIRRLYAVQERQQADHQSRLLATAQTMERAVGSILAEVAPSHVLAVFDGQGDSWRKALYPDYKAGRNAMPEALAEGLELLQARLWSLGVDALLSDTDEADDLIATLMAGMASHGQPVTLISTDKGFCQLLPQGLQIRDYFNKRWLDEAFVRQHFGVPSTALVDYWALCGLAGSNIKGVPGIGPKGAAELLGQYGNLDTLLSVEAADKRLHKVQQAADEARLAQTLVRLRQDIPLGFNLKDIRYTPHSAPST